MMTFHILSLDNVVDISLDGERVFHAEHEGGGKPTDPKKNYFALSIADIVDKESITIEGFNHYDAHAKGKNPYQLTVQIGVNNHRALVLEANSLDAYGLHTSAGRFAYWNIETQMILAYAEIINNRSNRD